jgi:hypothetical protein
MKAEFTLPFKSPEATLDTSDKALLEFLALMAKKESKKEKKKEKKG